MLMLPVPDESAQDNVNVGYMELGSPRNFWLNYILSLGESLVPFNYWKEATSVAQQ